MITVGVCAYNEEKSIAKALNSVLPQLKRNDELIVVASACTDKTSAVVRRMMKSDKRIKLIEEKSRSGKGSAQNVIVKKAKNKIIVFTDADLILEKDAIKNLLPYFNDAKVGVVMGKTVPFSKDSFFARLQVFGWNVLHERRLKECEDGSLFAINGYLFAVRKSAFVNIERSSTVEDALLGWNIKKNGYLVVYEPKAKVLVNPPDNFRDYVAQKKRTRFGWFQMKKEGMEMKSQRSVSDLKYLFTDVYAWPYFLLDLFIWIAAYVDFKRNKNLNEIWKRVHSSKI